MRPSRLALVFVLALFGAVLLEACSRPQRGSPDHDQNGRPIESVSPVPPDRSALVPAREMVPVLQLPRIESVGACGPVYKTGQRGACINDTPCRGFGVRGENGQALCTCYGQVGGCSENQRCDDRKLTCVPDDEPPRERERPR
jgi:hypothetical protein